MVIDLKTGKSTAVAERRAGRAPAARRVPGGGGGGRVRRVRRRSRAAPRWCSSAPAREGRQGADPAGGEAGPTPAGRRRWCGAPPRRWPPPPSPRSPTPSAGSARYAPAARSPARAARSSSRRRPASRERRAVSGAVRPAAVTQPPCSAPPHRRRGRRRRPRYTPVELAKLLRLPAPTREQAEIIAAPVEPLLVVAGAGSGKTETMAAAGGLAGRQRVRRARSRSSA